MNPPPLRFALSLLLIAAYPAAAQDSKQEKDFFAQMKQMKAQYAGKPQGPAAGVAACGGPDTPCKCEGKNGAKKFFHLILYQQNGVVGSNFTNDILFMASYALKTKNVELIKPKETDDGKGGHQLFSYPKDADCNRRSEADKKKDPLCVIPVDDMISLCQVVRDAFKAHAPPNDAQHTYFPVFEVWFGGSLKKQIGTDVAGKNFPRGSFKDSCSVVGEAEGLPDYALALVDAKPDQELKQVLIHEMGHAIGTSVDKTGPAKGNVGTAKDWFEDLKPGVNATADVKNIMASEKALSKPEELEISPYQTNALCRSPYVSDTP